MEHKIVHKPRFRVVGMEVVTSMTDEKNKKDCPDIWTKFMPRINELTNKNPGVCYGLCIMLNETDFRYIAAVETDDEIPEGMIELEIPDSDYVMITHKGHVSKMCSTWDALYKEVLPKSGREEIKEGISFEYYDHRYKDDETNETDLYIPVK